MQQDELETGRKLGGVRERERGGDREGDRERQTQRETERYHTKRQTVWKEREMGRDWERERQRERKTGRSKKTETEMAWGRLEKNKTEGRQTDGLMGEGSAEGWGEVH